MKINIGDSSPHYSIKEGFNAMDVQAVHKFLSEESYWAAQIPFEIVKNSLKNSFCVGIFYNDRQIGFARLVTDYTTFAYLADVYIEQEHRGRGLSKMLMDYIMEKEWVKNLRRFALATADAHSLYSRYGFVPLAKPERFMEINRPDIYKVK
ncbi:GNAT family N-acetyltransferase [Flavobacterium sp. MK4S-17]|uniref:GNAT family N-acetyltransferase n=1 Tax=Flavobacterium sp. MK4S-17 TaxID=2543737 RepID=UPI001359747F|nr:GNAT family N-acetyltransferase [Flavobacterium sp. MK4S-17]